MFSRGAFKDMSCGKDLFSVGVSKDKSCGKDVELFSFVIDAWRRQEHRVTSGDERRSVSRRRERHFLSKWPCRVGESASGRPVDGKMLVSRRRERHVLSKWPFRVGESAAGRAVPANIMPVSH